MAKKRKTYAEWMKENYGATNDYRDNIAPVKQVSSADVQRFAKETEEKKGKFDWFESSSAFDDGYDFGDILTTARATTQDASIGILQGLGNMAEGVTDLALYGVSGLSKLVGADSFANDVKKFAEKDHVNQAAEWYREKVGTVDLFNPNPDGSAKTVSISDYSVLGETSDATAQALGQIAGVILTGGAGQAAGLSQLGVSALTTGSMFASSAGSGIGEAYKSGATDGEAFSYGMAKGTVDAVSELIFGGLGKGVKALGLSRGLSSVDDIFAKKLSEKISSRFLKNAVQFGVKASAEGLEEMLAGIGTAVAKSLTYMSDDETSWTENVSKLIEDENLLEQFVVGALTSGIAQGGDVYSSIKTDTDFITGLNTSEDAVVNKVYESEIVKAEKDGKTLSKKEKAALYDDVMKKLERGEISLDTIEEVLGGDNYTQYQNLVKEADEFNTLYETESGKLSKKQQDRLAELEEKNKANSYENQLKELRDKLSSDVFNLAKGSKLEESYREAIRQTQKFDADLEQYSNPLAKKTVKNAIDRGLMYNGRDAHDFVDFAAKISEDKGYEVDFVTTEILQKMVEEGNPYNLEADPNKIEAFVSEKNKKILVNLDAKKSLNSLLGHEITDTLRKTKHYAALQKAAFSYAQTKGEYDTRLESVKRRYKNINADINGELTSDLCGDYLATDYEFIQNLAANHQNVFQQIWNEIKHLCKLATAGSKEARQLESMQHNFEKAWRETTEAKKNSGTIYNLNSNAKTELHKALYDTKYRSEVLLRDESPSIMVSQDGVKNLPMAMRAAHIRENVFTEEEAKKLGLRVDEHTHYHGLGEEFFLQIIDGLDDVKEAYRGTKNAADSTRRENYFLLVSEFKDQNGNTINVPVYIDEHAQVNRVFVDVNKISTVFGRDSFRDYINRQVREKNLVRITNKSTQSSERSALFALGYGKDALVDGSITQPETDVKPKNSISETSLSDSDGRQLSVKQQEYFKDSKVRDENGNLKVMYHGTQDAGFHVFDSKFSDDDTSFFFVDRNEAAASYSGTTETYEAKSFRTAEDANKFFVEIGKPYYEVVEENGKYVLLENGDFVAESDTAKGIYDEYCDWDGVGYGDANYKVYLNLKNPLVVDAEGQNWNRISSEFSQEVYDRYQALTAEEKDALHDLAEWEDIGIFRDGIKEAANGTAGTFSDDYQKLLASAYKKLGDVDMYRLFDIATDNFAEESLKENALKYLNTRDYARRAKEQGYDGVIFNNIVDLGGYSNGSEGAATVAIAFDANQIKSVANENPTSDPDIRYSISEDSKGRELSPAVQNRFAKSKVVDENGNLKPVFHGTASGEFTIFDKSKGNAEGDFGSGFYFTDNEFDVEEHYEGGGPDFENKVARLAERIESEEDIDYDEAEKRAREELFKGSHKFEVYLNIENPAIVGETNLFESESYFDEYNREDYENEEDYYGEVEQLVADDIDNIIWDIDRNIDVNSTDGIAEILWNAFNDGGVGIEQLKAQINELYLEDSEGNLVGNEVTRQIIESLGYDGIIDSTVSGKWNMDMEAGTTHYIVFKPNQIKDVSNQSPTDNPDIFKSLSDPTAAPKEYGNWNIYGKDIRYKGAPTQEDIAPTQTEAADNIAPIYTEPVSDPSVDELEKQKADLEKRIMEAMQAEDIETFNQLSYEHQALTERINQINEADAKFQKDRLASLEDADAPIEQEEPFPGEPLLPDDPMSDRNIDDVGSKKVKAYMYENPEVKPFFQQEAEIMLTELQGSTKGEKIYNDDLYYQSHGEQGWIGIKRNTTADIANLLDEFKYTYAQIEKGLKAIIEDNGAENNAISKRIEFALNARLLEGYTDLDGRPIPPNQEYIDFLNEKQITEYNEGSFNRYLESLGDRAAPAEDIAPIPETAQKAAPVKEAYEAIKPKQEKEPRMARATPQEEARAEILTEEPKVEKNKRSGWSMFREKVLDKGSVFEKLSLKTKNRELMGKWNYTLSSESRAQRFMQNGADGVKSLDTIRKEVESTGKTKEFFEYLYHKHNVDRMNLEERYEDTENKPVFGYSVTSEVSQGIVDQYETENPDFKAFADDVYSYMNHLRKQMVDSGVISQETADLWAEMYPHYVPIRRAGDSGLNIDVPLDTGRTGVNAPIKRAKGGNRDILPLFDTMAQRTIQTYKAIAKNNFGVELKNTLGSTIESDTASVDDVIDSIDTQDELLQEGKNGKNPTFTVFENGEKVTFEITDEMYSAMKPKSDALSYRNKILNTMSSFHRGLLTQYNPVFMVTNAIKDVQDVLINSQHATKTYATLPKAYKELATKGKWYTEYMDNGGEQNTYFDSSTNTFTEEKKGIRKLVGMPIDIISAANNFIEMAPRLAEYIASREAGASVEVAMLDAARVTTNFSAGGDLTKFLDGNGATFLNASIQGAMQQVRNVREAKANGLKGWVNLATKFAIAGLPAMILNGLLWDDDEEYEELADYVKDNYYIVAKYGDGQFVRIPKGRALAVIQNAMEQVKNAATGEDEVDLKSFLDLAITNLAPNNPLDSNILAPIMQVANNETWYGEDLVPTRLQDLPAAEQFDESTDAFSKWLGETLNYSPYKINYLLNQYSGGAGDVLLPMLTPEAESGDNSLLGNMIAPLKDKFTTDSVMNNQNVSDFYDTKDKLTANAKSSKATDEDVLKNKFFNAINSELSDLYKRKREIQSGNLPDAEKYEAVREIQKEINALTKYSLDEYNKVSITGSYATVGDLRYRLTDKGEWTKVTDKQYEKQKEVTSFLDISGSEYWSNKTEYDFAYEYPERYAVAKSVGGFEAYKKYTSELYDIKADKDSSGKSISGSRKSKVVDYVNSLDIDYGEAIILFKSEYKADDTYNYDIIEYLNSRSDISYEEMETILKELGFTVYSDGRIAW